ncbi:MAG: RNA methyltransferase [Bacteroidia bacterium]
MRKLQLTELNRKSHEEFHSSAKWPVRIILDNIRSAHNVGSIFRTSDAFLIEEIYLCGITATPPNKEILKSALGATNSVKWQHFQTSREAVEHCKNENYQIICVEQTTESMSLKDFKSSGPIALIFGNEVNGVDDKLFDLVDLAIEIPQFGTKHSFNVSVCAGIVIYGIFDKMQITEPQ